MSFLCCLAIASEQLEGSQAREGGMLMQSHCSERFASLYVMLLFVFVILFEINSAYGHLVKDTLRR